MRVLLINSNRFKQPWPVIPFGLCCVGSAVENAGHEVRVLDLCFSRKPKRDIARAVDEFEPDLVGISIRNIDNGAGYNTQFLLEAVRQDVVRPCKKAFSGPIVIGGPAVGINAVELLTYFDLEFAVRGDGEAAMIEFLHRIENGMSMEGLGGLVRRVDGDIVEDNEPLVVEDLDELPISRSYRYVDLKRYRRYGSPIQIQTKRGCALNCIYCTYNRIEGRRWRLRDPQKVADEIETIVRETGMRYIEFTDSTFNVPLDHAKAVLRAIEAKGLDLDLRTMGLNPGAVDEELVDLLKRTGFRDVDLGVESGCNRMLRNLGKNFDKGTVLEAGRLLQEKGIPVTWYLLLGGPGETRESVRETFETLDRAASEWDLVNVGIGLRVYNGSPVAQELRAANPRCTRDSFLRPVTYRPAGLDLEVLKLLVKQHALNRTNVFMYDEDEDTPLFLLRVGTLILRLFAPRQPIWRLFIFPRKMQRKLGILAVRRLWLNWRQRRLKEAQTEMLRSGLTQQRVSRLLTGMGILTGATIAYFTPWGYLLLLGMAVHLIQFAFTGRCKINEFADSLGILYEHPPRHLVLEPEHQEADTEENGVEVIAKTFFDDLPVGEMGEVRAELKGSKLPMARVSGFRGWASSSRPEGLV